LALRALSQQRRRYFTDVAEKLAWRESWSTGGRGAITMAMADWIFLFPATFDFDLNNLRPVPRGFQARNVGQNFCQFRGVRFCVDPGLKGESDTLLSSEI